MSLDDREGEELADELKKLKMKGIEPWLSVEEVVILSRAREQSLI